MQVVLWTRHRRDFCLCPLLSALFTLSAFVLFLIFFACVQVGQAENMHQLAMCFAMVWIVSVNVSRGLLLLSTLGKMGIVR